MKAGSTALINFLATAENYVFAHLYTITLSGGAVLRYTDSDLPVSIGGFTFSAAPGITDSGVNSSRGVSVDTLSVTIQGDTRYAYGGVPIPTFIAGGGLNGALMLVERAFATTWTSAWVGKYIRFSGRVGDITDADDTQATVAVNSWLELLNLDVPADVYQASCLNTLYDSKCQVPRASYAANTAVSSSTTTTMVFAAAAPADGYLNLGTVVFTSGANAGLKRTIKSQVGQTLTFVLPLPTPSAAGDTITLYPGCDLSMGTCSTKFNNLIRFRGQPFVPLPSTAA